MPPKKNPRAPNTSSGGKVKATSSAPSCATNLIPSIHHQEADPRTVRRTYQAHNGHMNLSGAGHELQRVLNKQAGGARIQLATTTQFDLQPAQKSSQQVATAAAGARASKTKEGDDPTFPIPTGPVSPPFVTQESYQIYDYLQEMPNCVASMEQARGDVGGKVGTNQPMKDTIPFTMQHIDGKSIGGLCVLRELGARQMYGCFIGYNPVVIPGYFEDFNDLPPDALQATILEQQPGSFGDNSYYGLAKQQRFVTPLAEVALNTAMKTGGGITAGSDKPMNYLQANRCLAVFMLLRAFADAIATKQRVVVFEDGGYMNPVIDAALDADMTVADFRKKYGTPAEAATDQKLPAKMRDVCSQGFVGSCELTRNGYDGSRCLYEEREAKTGKGYLNTRFFSIAISYLKIMIEGDNITLACLNGLDQVLYGIGWSYSHRNVCVMGSRGNLGRRFCKHASEVARDGKAQLVGFDMKLDWPAPGPLDTPDWQTPWNVENPNVNAEYVNFKSIPEKTRLDLDCIMGFTGGPTTDAKNPSKRYTTYDGDDFAEWLLKGTKPVMFLCSGSTKTQEFDDVLAYLAHVIAPSPENRNINGVPCDIEHEVIPDTLTIAAVKSAGLDATKITRNFGTQYAFRLHFPAAGSTPAKSVIKVLYLVNNTMPVNFMFYGTATEIIDYTMSQVSSATAKLCGLYKADGPTGLLPGCYPTDYNRQGSDGVYYGRKLKEDYNSPPSSGVPSIGQYNPPK